MSGDLRNKFTILWTIENFTLHYYQSGESISSPQFIFENVNYSRWFLRLFPRGEKAEFSNYISIFLHRDDDEKVEEILIDFKIHVYDGNGKLLETLMENDKVFKGNQFWGCDMFIKRDELLSKLNEWKERSLTVSCELSCKQVDKPYVSNCEARTKVGFDQYSFERDFDITESPLSFSMNKFSVQFNLKAPNDEFEIEVVRSANANLNCSFRMVAIKISLMDVKGVEVVTKRDSHTFTTYQAQSTETWKFPSFFSNSMLLNRKDTLLQKNIFTLRFEISFPTGHVISSVTSNSRNSSPVVYFNSDVNAISALIDDFREMLALKKHCDVKLRIGDQGIAVHKAVLAARSEVFSAMFDQDMIENQTGIVEIKDMTLDAVNSLLEFFYTGSVKGLDYEKALELLIAADKYQVLSLKEKCFSFLVSVFTETNVCDVLVTADIIGYLPLKSAAIDYIKKNHKMVVNTTKWPEWVKVNPALASEIIIQLSNNV